MPFPFPELHNNVSSHNYTYKLNQLLRELRDKEAQLGVRHRGEMVRARARRDEAEAPLEDLELRQTGDLDTDQETELLESIKRSHELLEAERIFFEDLEFRQMEKEPSLEAEMEDAGRDVEAEAGDDTQRGAGEHAGHAGGVHPQARAGEGEDPRPRPAGGGQQGRAGQRGQRPLGRGRQGERLGGEQHHQEDNIVFIVLYLSACGMMHDKI